MIYTVDSVKEMIKVMQAYVDGKTVQVQDPAGDGEWNDLILPYWNWDGFAYRIKPEVYKLGDKFVLSMELSLPKPEVYALCQVVDSQVCLVGLKSFDRWANPVKVSDPFKITAEEFKKISGNKFTPLTQK